jgi:hypothetical protein
LAREEFLIKMFSEFPYLEETILDIFASLWTSTPSEISDRGPQRETEIGPKRGGQGTEGQGGGLLMKYMKEASQAIEGGQSVLSWAELISNSFSHLLTKIVGVAITCLASEFGFEALVKISTELEVRITLVLPPSPSCSSFLSCLSLFLPHPSSFFLSCPPRHGPFSSLLVPCRPSTFPLVLTFQDGNYDPIKKFITLVLQSMDWNLPKNFLSNTALGLPPMDLGNPVGTATPFFGFIDSELRSSIVHTKTGEIFVNFFPKFFLSSLVPPSSFLLPPSSFPFLLPPSSSLLLSPPFYFPYVLSFLT